jgi:hypothetical protein
MKRIALLAVAAALLLAAPASAFDANDLAKFLPDTLGGLKATAKADTLSMTIQDKRVLHASRKYAAGDQKMTVMIRAGGYTVQMAASIKMKIALENNHMILKPITVQGNPGQLVVQKDNKQVSVRVQVGDKLIITRAENTVDPATTLKVLGDMKLKDLAALK